MYNETKKRKANSTSREKERRDAKMDSKYKGLKEYEQYLYERERHSNTIEKYLRDIRHFFTFVCEQGMGDGDDWEQVMNRELVIRYKECLLESYKVVSVNSMLIALNGYLRFIGREDCCVKTCRVQRQIFREEEKELSWEEYRRLVMEAEKEGNLRLSCILQTVGSTGIRIGELAYITVESLDKLMVSIRFKGKERRILLPKSLVALLRAYCEKEEIRTGSIFVTRSGNPVDRRNVWSEIKKLCRATGIPEGKGFPHNLRHLFARTYYEKEKDIIRLADYLGHSSVETTRRYTMTSNMESCLKQLEMGMLVGKGAEEWKE